MFSSQRPRIHLNKRFLPRPNMYYHSMKIVKLKSYTLGTFLLGEMSLNVITVKLFLYSKNQFLKNLCSGTQCGGFQFLLILDLWGISFHAVLVFGLIKNIVLKSVLELPFLVPSKKWIIIFRFNEITNLQCFAWRIIKSYVNLNQNK